MSNVKHQECAIRNMAKSAKKRLCENDYSEQVAPRNATPSQKALCEKIVKLKQSGEDVINPVEQLADKELLSTLSHEQRQRYIINLCADYVSVKKFFDAKSEAG